MTPTTPSGWYSTVAAWFSIARPLATRRDLSTEWACLAAQSAGLPVAARTAPGACGSWPLELGADATVGRAIQLSAVAAHASQSAALPRLRQRLDLQTGPERLRWLWWPPGV